MIEAHQLFINSLEIKFLDIRQYDLDFTWKIKSKRLAHSVLWLLLEGSLSLTLDQIGYRAGKGSALLLPDQAVLSSFALSDRLRLISINFDARIPLLVHRNWAHILQLPVCVDKATGTVRKISEMMLDAADTQALGNNLLLQAGILQIVSALLKEYGGSGTLSAAPGFDQRVLTIIAYLAAHPGWFPEVGQMAELVQMSTSHVRHLFVKHTGQAPMHFVHTFKIDAACKLLVFECRRVSEIAYHLGYKDPNYFSRIFRSRTGLSPLEYRKRNRLLEI